jgi:hypothetical protein
VGRESGVSEKVCCLRDNLVIGKNLVSRGETGVNEKVLYIEENQRYRRESSLR